MTIPVPFAGQLALETDVVARSAGDEMILLDLETGELFHPQRGRSRYLEGPGNRYGLPSIVCARWWNNSKSTRPPLAADIAEYLDALIDRGLVLRK